MRTAEIVRKTRETDIRLSLNLDGTGKNGIDTGVGFLNHMLELFSVHSGADLEVKCVGDTQVDYHHSVEDVGICLGQAFRQALGEKRGIARFADDVIPMDECAAQVALDISGRPYLSFAASWKERSAPSTRNSWKNFSAPFPPTRASICTWRCCAAAICTTRRRRCSRHLQSACRTR